MALRGFLLGAAFMAAGLLPAAADSVTSTVHHWDASTRTLMLADKTQYQTISDKVAVPENIAAGRPSRSFLTDRKTAWSPSSPSKFSRKVDRVPEPIPPNLAPVRNSN